MAIDISGIFFFMPVFSFLFVLLIVYAILHKTKILGESGFVNIFISLIIAIIFMSFSSLELYVRTILPWFVVLLVVVFLILLIAGLSTKQLDKIMTQGFAWFFIAVLIIVFLIAAIYVFNPVFHPDLVVAGGAPGDRGVVSQIRDFFGPQGGIGGSVLLVIVAGLVAWVLTRK